MDAPKPLIFDGMSMPPFKPLVENAEKRFTDIRNLEYRKDDIIIVTYPKSGTHWIWEVVCMLINGNTEYTKEVKEFFFLEAIPDLNVLDNLSSPRLLNTHIPYRWLPKQHIENSGKIIHFVRNPKDVAVSLYHHALSAGIPVKFTFNEFIEKMFVAKTSVWAMESWFKYVKDFEQAAQSYKDGASFTLYYENMKKNPIEETKRLAKFLNIDASDELIEGIVEKCSFENLKRVDETLKDQSIIKDIIALGTESGISKKPNMFRKGIIGDWKNHFTVAVNEKFDRLFEEEMKDSKLQIQFE